MNYKYMSDEAPVAFPASSPLAEVVYLNADKTRFKLRVAPSMHELRAAIDDYADARLRNLWREMSLIENGACKLFECFSKSIVAKYANKATVAALLGEDKAKEAFLGRLDEKQLANALGAVKPTSFDEAEALYSIKRGKLSAVGRDYLQSIAASSASALEFYDQLIGNLFEASAGVDPAKGTISPSYYQPRVYEFLGYSVARGWVLFPFIHSQSGIREHQHMAHGENSSRIFSEYYRHPAMAALFLEISEMKIAKSTDIGREKHVRNLMLASTFRTVEQATTPLFQACIDLVMQANEPMTVQEAGKLRKTYNSLLKLHNSRCAGAPPQELIFEAKPSVSLDDFASFADLRALDPRMERWSTWFEEFVKETKDTQGQVRKTACNEFADFLRTMPAPPLSPLEVTRAHINDYKVGSSSCYRGFLAQRLSAASGNLRLNLLAQFFAFVKERLVATHKGNPVNAPWLAQPVDMKFDRFVESLKSGTTRKAIAAHVMEEMRNVLTEEDYAWSKLQGGWAHLVNEETRTLEYVWCPSAALLLYTLVSLPLRSLQARLFDSGEGDAIVFDFEKCAMVPNLKQVPVEGAIDPNRREGIFQVIPSGMLDVVDIIGIWVPVNKISDRGYHIPWVSEDLLKHIRYQHEWVRQYSANPNPHGIIEVQGHRNQPEEWVQSQSKFFCLFRDPSTDRVYDPSLPVSKQKLLKLWTALCAETERRINSHAKSESQRVKLVEVTESGRTKALHDIHTLRVSGITDLLDRGVPLNIVSEYVAGHATYIMTLWYDKPSPGQIRRTLKACEAAAGQSRAAIPKFNDDEVDAMRPHLVVNSSFEGMYTGFDAVRENAGLLQFRLGGICPGTRCEEGGLTTHGRITAVPVGDRGPSCPQCRFWLTGPAFLLGQCIEGNQLILKIRNKVQSLDILRGEILEADDSGKFGEADVLRGQADVEERQLNDMLTEWWHRMKLYEASVHKLDGYRKFLAEKDGESPDVNQVMLVADNASAELSFSFKKSTKLELEHFLSTCAEVLPNYAYESKSVALDLEMAVGKFLAINEHKDLTSLYFTLTDDQRLTAANMTVEMLLGSAEDPSKAADLLEGRTPLKTLPKLQKALSDMLLASSKATSRTRVKTIPIEVAQ